jgi:uncharacterized membrane protein YphA (DoxX/SURF4 family)
VSNPIGPYGTMNNLTRVFLVLLRLAIGWHLLFAGVVKFRPEYRGSEGYLRESSGPLAPAFQWMAGDRLVDELAVRPLGPDRDPATTPLNKHFPKALEAEWEAYFQRFVRHYDLDKDDRDPSSGAAAVVGVAGSAPASGPMLGTEVSIVGGTKQLEWARVKLEQQKYVTTGWLLHGTKEVKKTSPYGPPIEVTRTTPQRVEDYVKKRDEIRARQRGEYAFSLHTLFAADKTRELQAEKAELARMRSDLSKDLDAHTAAMKEALRDVLTPAQIEKGPVPEPVRVGWTDRTRLDWIDFQVRWGLVLVGSALLLGLCTRTACVVGAVLLLSFYLAVPPLPDVPEALRVEGYPYVNKNLVEMLALLTLATTASGRWAGLDFLLSYLNPWRKKAATRGPAPAYGPPHSDHGARAPDRVPAPVTAPERT